MKKDRTQLGKKYISKVSKLEKKLQDFSKQTSLKSKHASTDLKSDEVALSHIHLMNCTNVLTLKTQKLLILR